LGIAAAVRVFKNAWFAKFARRENISDGALCEAVRRAERGLIDGDLGGGLIKQRIARAGEGKSSGFRTLVFFRRGELSVFAFGFAKSTQANIGIDELAMFKKAAKVVLALSPAQIEIELVAERLIEARCDNQIL
jgi:hypothetical protein